MVNWGLMEDAPKWFDKSWTQLNFPFSEEEELEIQRYCEKIKEHIQKYKMTPWERWKALTGGQEMDRAYVHIHPETTYSVRVLDGFADALKPIDSFKNPKIFLKAHICSISRFGSDVPQIYTYTYGESVWGGKAKFLERAHPVMYESGVKTLDDAKRLEIPDPKKDGAYPGMLWMIHEMKQKFKEHGLGDLVPVGASVCVPPEWIISNCIRGLRQGFLDPIKNPDIWHELIKKTTEFEIRYALALREAGADIVWCCQHHAAWPPQIFKEHIAPYDAELVKRGRLDGWAYAFNQAAHVKIAYEAGLYDKPVNFLEFDIETPLEFITEFTKEIGLAYICLLHDKVLLAGEEKIAEYVKKALTLGARGFAGGAIDYWTPPQNVDAFVKTVKEYGKFPLRL